MKTFFNFIFLLLVSSQVNSQIIFVTDNRYDADVKVYVTSNRYRADWWIYNTDNRYD